MCRGRSRSLCRVFRCNIITRAVGNAAPSVTTLKCRATSPVTSDGGGFKMTHNS